MRNYVQNPEDPSHHIDVIERLVRHPSEPPPPYRVVALMRRDKWSRQEALLILAGYHPCNVVDGAGHPVGTIGAGTVYLDGTTKALLDNAGIQHPLNSEMLPDYLMLADYAKGEPMEERRTPQEWLSWAESKGFKPYWLEYLRKREGATSKAAGSINESLHDTEHNFISVADTLARIQETTGVTRKQAATFLSLLQSKNDFPSFVFWAEEGLYELTDVTDAPHQIAGALAAVAVGKSTEAKEEWLAYGGFDENQIFPILQAKDARITRSIAGATEDVLPENGLNTDDVVPATKSKKPPLTEIWREEEIIRLLIRLGYDPLALPKNEPGKGGVPSEVRGQLQANQWQGGTFKKAWERLSQKKQIKYVP